VHFGDALEEVVDMVAGEQIFIPGNVPHAPSNESDAPCTWIVVHGAGSDQEGIAMLPELDELLTQKLTNT